MVQPQNERQTKEQEPIYPGIKWAIFVGISKHDDVWKLSKLSKDEYI